MVEIKELEGRVSECPVEAAQARVVAENAYGAWARTQAALLAPFLIGQARQTAMKQSEVTEASATEIPRLKAAVNELGQASERSFRTEFGPYVEPLQAYQARKELTQRFHEFTTSITAKFGSLMTELGYDSGSVGGRHPGLQPAWGYYRAGQTGRVSFIALAPEELTAYEEAELSRQHADTEMVAAQKCLSERRAAALWED